jgi:hypothetical protein
MVGYSQKKGDQMVYLFATVNPEEIRKIKAEYFNKNSERYQVPILENPDDGFDVFDPRDATALDELISKIIDDSNSVVICSKPFKDLVRLAINGRKASSFGVTATEAADGLRKTQSAGGFSEALSMRSHFASIGIDLDDSDIEQIRKMVCEINAAGYASWWDIFEICECSFHDDMINASEALKILSLNSHPMPAPRSAPRPDRRPQQPQRFRHQNHRHNQIRVRQRR